MDYPRITNFCAVCGFDHGEPIWGEDGHCPTFNICDHCSTVFGYEDITPYSINIKRQKLKKENIEIFEDKILKEFR